MLRTIKIICALLSTAILSSTALCYGATSRNADLECGPAADGQQYTWINTTTHQIWVAKSDNLDQALALKTTSWSMPSQYSMQAIATIQMGWLGLTTYKFSMTPVNGRRSLVVTIMASDGSSWSLPPVKCQVLFHLVGG